jgi:hypothetical protein
VLAMDSLEEVTPTLTRGGPWKWIGKRGATKVFKKGLGVPMCFLSVGA